MKVIFFVAVILLASCDLSYTAGAMGNFPDFGSLLGLNNSQLANPTQLNAALTSLNNTDSLNALIASLGNGTTDDAKDIMDALNNLSNSSLNASSLLNSLNSSQNGLGDLTSNVGNLFTPPNQSNLNPVQTAPGTNNLAGLLSSFGNGGGNTGPDFGNLLNTTNPTNPAPQADLGNLFSSLQKPMTPQNLQNIGNIFQNMGQNGGFTFGPEQNALLQTLATFLGITPSDQKLLEEFYKDVGMGKYTPMDLIDPYSEARPALNVFIQFTQKQTEAAVRQALETTLFLLFLIPHF